MLVDTTMWIDMFRRGEPELLVALEADLVQMHPFVLGELAVGNISPRRQTLSYLSDLPPAAMATEDEVLALIEYRSLHGRGIGYVDAHLIASCLLSGATLWTRDRRLNEVAADVGAA